MLDHREFNGCRETMVMYWNYDFTAMQKELYDTMNSRET